MVRHASKSAIISGFTIMSRRQSRADVSRIEANLKKALGRDLTPEESRLLSLTIPALEMAEPDTEAPGTARPSKKA
jgi:hypothetical protein